MEDRKRRIPQEAGVTGAIPPALVELLVTTPDLSADDVLIAALAHADAVHTTQIVDIILSRDSAGGLRQLIAMYHTLEDAHRRQIIRRVSLFEDVLRSAVASHGERTRLNCIDIIRDGMAYRSAYLLCSLLTDECREVRDAAAGTLLGLAAGRLADPGSTAADESMSSAAVPQPGAETADSRSEETSYLLEAVRQALSTYAAHRRVEAVRAAMYLAPCIEEEFDELFSPGRSRVGYEALALLEREPTPEMAGFAWRALSSLNLRMAAARTISRCRCAAFMREWFIQAPPLERPRVRWGLRLIKRMAWLEGGAQPLLELPADRQSAAIDLLEQLGLPGAVRYRLLRELLCGPPCAGQRAALAGMICAGGRELQSDLRMIDSWGDPLLSPVARAELEHRTETPDVAGGRRRRGTGGRLAVDDPGDERPLWEQYWDDFEALPEERRFLLGEAVLRNRAEVLAGLGVRCRSESAAERRKAVEVIRHLEVEEALAAALRALARDGDATVRSAALTALGAVRARGNRRLFVEALEDEDPRVRANALDAMDRQGLADGLESARRLLRDRHQRVRANAISGLLRLGDRGAGEELIRLLEDRNRAHRISGLWVVGRMRLAPLLARVRTMAEQDADPVVQRRASDTAVVLEIAAETENQDNARQARDELVRASG